MANRSDRGTKSLPRQLKRMLSGGVTRGYIDPYNEGIIRKIMIGAHQHSNNVKNKRQTLLTNVDKSTEIDDDTTVQTV